jgi:aminoglycoside/choline kinase family phosphotransferase|eukprot:COSAG01_NODE_780_length_13660_cov_171.194233_3_plen_95_part_00
MVALAQTMPTFTCGDADVMAMLRAVELGRGASTAAGSTAAAATWRRMTESHNALVHGDYHPGNLLLSRAWLRSHQNADGGSTTYAIDFQRKFCV